jgi:uncharacterized metal-binding protein YceD (DUF177 family)
MQIEFKKVPQQLKDFFYELNSVKFLGTFRKISPKLVDIKSKFDGKVEVNCSKCNASFTISFYEEINFLVSDGIYLSNDDRDLDKIIIEMNNGLIDFKDIFQSELESFKSDYYLCDNCSKDETTIELEY